MTSPGRAVFFLACLAVAGFSAGATANANGETVTIGVRVDAGPFARRDPDTGRFRGYLVDLCREAVTRASFTFTERPVTAGQRISILEGNLQVSPEADDEAGEPWKLDLLCDPTTLSLKRLDTFATLADEVLAFSPVVFVANGSFVTLKKKAARDRAKLEPAVKCPLPVSGEGPPPEVFVAGYVEGVTSEIVVRRVAKVATNQALCLWAAKGHDEAVAALCGGGVDYYFGDLDIIEFYRSHTAETRGSCAEIEPPRQVLSYEPYALLVSNNTAGFRPRFFAALYELFSDGTAAQRFASHFGGASQSTALNLLFRINSVPGLRDE